MVSRKVQQRRRQFVIGGVIVFGILVYLLAFSGGSGKTPPATTTTTSHHGSAVIVSGHFPRNSPLDPAWKGDGKTVTIGFAGDVHFEGTVGADLANDPSTALGTTIPQLFNGTEVSMVNLESAVTDGTCPEPQNKPYIFDAPASAVSALKSANVSLVKP